jgi:hypothetical protein
VLVQGRDPVLQRRQLGDCFGRDQVRARGQDLAELGEGGAELFQRLPQATRPQFRRVVVAA